MNFKSKIQYNYNIDNLMGDNNMVGEILKMRVAMSQNANKVIKDNKIYSIYTNRPFVYMRTPNITKSETVLEDDGILWHRTPMKPSEIGKKEGARFILHPDTISIGYWYKFPDLINHVNFVDNPINIKNHDSEEFIKHSIIVQNILHGPYNALMNVLRRKTNKKIMLIGNDVSIDGKKICGIDQFLNNSGTFQLGGINYNYEKEFFGSLLSKDAFHRKTNATAGLTGVSNEISGYSKEEFTEDWINELEKLISIAEELI